MIFKCKMCGGDLEITEGMTVCECDYCGTKQTIPNIDNEKKVNLFNRANRLRFNNEFDKAASIYENIVSEFPEEAEAYWGLCLCKYGVEYVDDPATAKKIPTCHRTSLENIFDDSNFELAQEYSDVVAQSIYREEAKEIDRLQKAILEIVRNEKPYDIFICYKETAEDGQRTKDSVFAQDIYDALIQKGYKVFFSRITLEDKLGQEYEPYIYAALSSAKIMLSIGTKYEYFNAVWVKNEWMRFLEMMKSDKSKVIIPCYADIDAYDMPEEFKNLQGQDMSKVGFIQDIVRGIGKIIPLESEVKSQQPIIQQVITGSAANTENLLRRGNLALEDKKWDEADKFFDKVLDENAEEARAYLGKLMAELKLSLESDFTNLTETFDENSNYKKVCRFADDDLKNKVVNYSIQANYNNACILFEKAKTINEFDRAADAFNKYPDFKDSKSKIDNCKKHIKDIKCEAIYNDAIVLLKSGKINNIKEAQQKFESIASWKNSKELAIQCANTITLFEQAKVERLDWAKNNWLHSIAAGGNHSVGLRADGTVVAVGDIDYKYQYFKKWTNIVSVSAGEDHIVGLKNDGTVIADGANYDGECNTQKWTNIISISCGGSHTVGLKSNGTVVAVGSDSDGQLNVSNWSGIILIAAGGFHTVGLKSDGTVVAVGLNRFDQCNVSGWRNIIAIFAGAHFTVGLKSDGTLVFTGNAGTNNQLLELSNWKNIVRVAAGFDFVIGLKSNGVMISAGVNGEKQCNVYDVRGAIDVAAGSLHTIYMKADRTAGGTGYNKDGQCRLNNFTDLRPIHSFVTTTDTSVEDNTSPSKGNSEGCYIATCVYGSYDCPQVWTLRRYRDYTLSQTWYGRAFIHIYYALSPTLVKWFGHTNWFKKIWKKKLDAMISDLQEKGVDNTPYQDKNW